MFSSFLLFAFVDRFCCGGEDPAGYSITVNGNEIASSYNYPNFGSELDMMIYENIGFTLMTDEWPEEVAIEILDVDTQEYVYQGGDFPATSLLSESFCVQSDHCVEMTILDSWGDGLLNGGFFKYRSGTQEVTADHTGAQAGPFLVTGGVGFDLLSDSNGGELTVQVYDFDAGSMIYEQSGFADNTLTSESFCVPENHCIEMNIYDFYGDGITGDGYFRFRDRKDIYDFPSIGAQATMQINGHIGFELFSDDWGEEITVQVYSIDTQSYLYQRTGFENNAFFSEDFCIADNECIEITIFDSYGDGLLSGYFKYSIGTNTFDVEHYGYQAGPFQINCE